MRQWVRHSGAATRKAPYFQWQRMIFNESSGSLNCLICKQGRRMLSGNKAVIANEDHPYLCSLWLLSLSSIWATPWCKTNIMIYYNISTSKHRLHNMIAILRLTMTVTNTVRFPVDRPLEVIAGPLDKSTVQWRLANFLWWLFVRLTETAFESTFSCTRKNVLQFQYYWHVIERRF